ncbi:MAG: sugar phosphate isomerase/epimerase family protein [Terriglobia bacterium]
MKISMSYLYVIFKYGYPHKLADVLKALPEIQKMGFRYLEMEGLGQPLLMSLYKNRDTLVKALSDSGLHVHNFCVVNPDLVSVDAARRSRALDLFKIGAEMGDLLGAETLHLASYAPPVRYLEAKPYGLGNKTGYRFVDQVRIHIPKGFDWNEVWSALVASCQACADIAAQHGKTVLMEPRIGEVICSVDSLLRLIEQVQRDNFKANFDTGHFSAQRENVVLALMKLQGQFANIHVADNDPKNANHLPIGKGVIDWPEFFQVLKNMNYQGYLGLDLGMSKTLLQDYRNSVARIQEIASKLRVPIEV